MSLQLKDGEPLNRRERDIVMQLRFRYPQLLRMYTDRQLANLYDEYTHSKDWRMDMSNFVAFAWVYQNEASR